MTYEEAIALVTATIAPQSLSELQINVLRGAWNKQSYHQISLELNHEYSYIKDVGAQLWQMLTQELEIGVTKVNLQDVLRQYALQKRTCDRPASLPRDRVDWGEAVDVSQFCGRQAQLAMLEQWVMQDCCRLIAIVGIGGIGKTMLVTQLAQQLADTEQFEVVVWRSLRQAPSFVDFLTELTCAIDPDRSLPQSLDAMMRHLLQQLRSRRCLLVLDNVETVFSSKKLVGTYRRGCENYGWLFQQLGEGQHQSSILLTSREIPTEVAVNEAPTASIRLLRLEPVSISEGETILASKGLTIAAQQPQVRELIERYQGNPLALKMVAELLKDLFDSNIAAFLAQKTLLFKDIRDLLAHQFDRLSWSEEQVMYWLAIDREAVTAQQLQAALPLVSVTKLRDALISLDRRSLIEKIKPTSTNSDALNLSDGVSYTQQPVVMEYVIERSIEQITHEVEQAQSEFPKSHTLLKVQTLTVCDPCRCVQGATSVPEDRAPKIAVLHESSQC
ncbi:NB-ARC domain-containing protein [Microcoleus sp. ARI1-B5]|uniref:NB-ARC domain-containing protein n=1 Tax=unclassified Microcoleus TaxID=2642155 RepID=UPI002FD6C93F